MYIYLPIPVTSSKNRDIALLAPSPLPNITKENFYTTMIRVKVKRIPELTTVTKTSVNCPFNVQGAL